MSGECSASNESTANEMPTKILYISSLYNRRERCLFGGCATDAACLKDASAVIIVDRTRSRTEIEAACIMC